MNFLGRGRVKDRRRAVRIGGPAVNAFYWTGGVCEPLRVRDISGGGAYVETETGWCDGTVIHLVLERPAAGQDSRKVTFELWALIVRNEGGGMGMRFIKMDRREERRLQRFLETVASVPAERAV